MQVLLSRASNPSGSCEQPPWCRPLGDHVGPKAEPVEQASALTSQSPPRRPLARGLPQLFQVKPSADGAGPCLHTQVYQLLLLKLCQGKKISRWVTVRHPLLPDQLRLTINAPETHKVGTGSPTCTLCSGTEATWPWYCL